MDRDWMAWVEGGKEKKGKEGGKSIQETYQKKKAKTNKTPTAPAAVPEP